MRILLASAPVINREIKFNLQTLLEYMKAYRGKVELIVFGESILQALNACAGITKRIVPSVSRSKTLPSGESAPPRKDTVWPYPLG